MTPVDEVKNEIELGGRLEAEAERHDVGMQNAREEISLRLDVFRVVLLKDAILMGQLIVRLRAVEEKYGGKKQECVNRFSVGCMMASTFLMTFIA